MLQFLNNNRISANTEVVCLLILGILFQMADGSPFQIKQQLKTIWGTDLPREYFSPFVQQLIKSALSIIVAGRCGATYPYVISSILVIFCIIKDRAPKLMLPWIFVAGSKSVFMTFLEALTGVYVCSAFGTIHKACIEFFISKAFEIIFAAYLWGSVLSVYQDMERRLENEKIQKNPEISYIKKLDLKRKRARSLLDESTLYKTACLNNFEFKDVPQIILQMLRRTDEMSRDSLLGPGMMLASVSNMGSFDNLKTSESLGELGYTNLESTKVIGLDEEENLSPTEKALKFLKITWSDVRKVQWSRIPLRDDIFSVNSDTWFQVTASDTHIYKPKSARTEVFIRELPELELEEDYIFPRKNFKKFYDLKLGVSLFNLIKKNELDFNEDVESFTASQEGAEEEHEEEEEGDGKGDAVLSQIFMSNIKEEHPVNRIRLNIEPKRIKGKAYQKLYKKPFMSVIGPEVLERATKLPKVTSFTDLDSEKNSKSIVSTANFREKDLSTPFSFEVESEFSNLIKSKESNYFLTNTGTVMEPTEDLSEEETTEMQEPKFESEAIPQETEDEKPNDKVPGTPLPDDANAKKKRPPCYRKRRIRIKWMGKLKENDLIECDSTNSSFSKISNSNGFDKKPETDSYTDYIDDNCMTELRRSYSSVLNETLDFIASDNYELGFTQDLEINFQTEVLRKPFSNALRKYHDVTHTRRSQQMEFPDDLFKTYWLKSFEETHEVRGKVNKVWKSKVLKTVEEYRKPITGDLLNVIDHEMINKLLKYKYYYLMSKIKNRSYYATSSLQTDSVDQSVGNTEQNSMKLALSKPSGKIFNKTIATSRENFTECGAGHGNERNFNNTPSEQSVEVCQKDLTEEEIYNTEFSRSLEDCTLEDDIKTSNECFEDAQNNSFSSQESDEPIYYSQAANLASPLLGMKKFIYPDHIHYSYKQVNKKGFDVNIYGDHPLLVQSQTQTTNMQQISPKPEPEIIRRPMDLSFAKTNAFAEWQNNDQSVSESPTKLNERFRRTETITSEETNKKKKGKHGKKTHEGKTNPSGNELKADPSSRKFHHVYFIRNYIIREKLKKMRNQLMSDDEDRKPVQISSTQLHSNKGRINSSYSPALRLEENKKEEKKKVETQEKRTKDMLARLEREILFQGQNSLYSNKPF